MSFAKVGAVITQTGTDADLSGVAAHVLAVYDLGAVKVYNFGNNSLIIQGDLSVNIKDDGVKEQMVIGTGSQSVIDIDVTSTGSLTVGLDADSVDGEYVTAQHTASIIEKDINLNFGSSKGKSDAWTGTSRPFLLVRAGGHFTWNGTIMCCGGIAFDGYSNAAATDSVIRLNNAVWDARTLEEEGNYDQILYSYTRDIVVKGLTVLCISALGRSAIFSQLATPTSNLKGYKGVFTDSAFCGSSTTPAFFAITYEDYAGIIGNDDAYDIQPHGKGTAGDEGDVIFLNGSKGQDLKLSSWDDDTYETLSATQGVKGVYLNENNDNTEDFVVATVDKDDLLYSDVGADGVFTFDDDVLLAKWLGGANTSPMVKTDYCPAEDGEDHFDFHSHSFVGLPQSKMQVQLRQLGGQDMHFQAFEDKKVTAASKTAANGIVSLSDPDKIYDASKAWKLTVAHVVYPTLAHSLIFADGDALDLGDCSLVLDPDFVTSTPGNPETPLTLDRTDSTEGAITTPTEAQREANLILSVDVAFHGTIDPVGVLLDIGGQGTAAGAASYNLGPYALATQADAETDFNFTDPSSGTIIYAAGQSRHFCWENNETGSTGVGPSVGQGGGTTEGYMYTEASSPAAAGDVFTVELDHDINCEGVTPVLTFYTNQRGDDNDATCKLQYKEGSGSWIDIETYGGPDDTNKVASAGTDIWALRTETIPSIATNVRVRWVITLAGTTVWHCDYGLDTIKLTATTKAETVYETLYMGFTDNELVFRAGKNTASPDDSFAEVRVDSTGWKGNSATTFYGVVDLDDNKVKLYSLVGGGASGNTITLLGTGTSPDGFDLWSTPAVSGMGEANGTQALGESTADFNGTVSATRFFFDEDEHSPFQPWAGDPRMDVNMSTDVITVECDDVMTHTDHFKQFVTTGKVTLKNDAILNDYTVHGDVEVLSAVDLTDLIVYGDLYINTGANSTVSYSGVQVSGNVFNSDAAHTLSINASDSSLSPDDAGTGNGQVNIVATVPVKVYVKTLDGTPIVGARVYLVKTTGGAVVISGLTDSTGLAENTSYSFTADEVVEGWVRKTSASPYYKQSQLSGEITSSGFEVTIGLISDE